MLQHIKNCGKITMAKYGSPGEIWFFALHLHCPNLCLMFLYGSAINYQTFNDSFNQYHYTSSAVNDKDKAVNKTFFDRPSLLI